MKTSELLDRAASNIEKYGLVKNQMGSKSVGFCGYGAVREVLESRLDSEEYSESSFKQHYTLTMNIYNYLDSLKGTNFSLVHYNDQRKTTQQDVVTLLLELASMAKSNDD